MIYQYTLAPIESILESIFVILVGVSDSYFLSLVLLAVLVRLATKPLEIYASRVVIAQAEIESVLALQIEAIKRKHIAGQRHEAIKRLYARYAYHPVFAIRSLAGLGVQLPFFIAAYFMLSSFPQLDGVVIPVLGDLSKPDTLLFGRVHLMPFIMTLVNVLALLTVPGFNRKNLTQGLFISLMFLVFLYDSPLGLLIYWTTSNLFSFISNISPAISKKLKHKKSKVRFKNTIVGRSFEEYAYLFFISNLALLIPLLGVLGEQFNFFTAHSLSGKSIIALLLVISLAPPLILSVLRWAIKRVKFVRVFDGIVLSAFLGLFLFYSLNKAGYGFFQSNYEFYILFFLALLMTAVAVVLILKNQLLRILSYLSLIIPLVFLNFIFVSPASTLFKHTDRVSSFQIAGMNDTPVFLLVFDELSGLTLQNLKGQLDASRFPGFAEMAAQADYFPNALTADYRTEISVPSIASGNLRIGDKSGLAQGENLIELFQSIKSVYAQSTVLSADLMSNQNTNLKSLISDLTTLYIHILSHQDWIEDKIGVIPQTWKGFGKFFKTKAQEDAKYALNPHARQFIDWVENVSYSEVSNQFNFLHIQFPHVQYTMTAMGKPVFNNEGIFNSSKIKETFSSNQSLLNVIYHNYMQQSVYTDRLIQKFIRMLKNKNLFDKSLIIVTSDHGVSYGKKGINRRVPVNKDSWKNIVSVPLLIKYPYQKEGRINSSFVTTLDLSTTILNVTGIDSPWKSVGQNLKGMKNNSQTRSVKLSLDYEKYFTNISALFQEGRVRRGALFGEGHPVHTIAVNYTENQVYDSLLKAKVTEFTTGVSSKLRAIWKCSLEPTEVSYFGAIYDDGELVNNKIFAAAVNGVIQAVFKSGKALNRDGFFAFSLPENKTTPVKFDVSLYEIEGKGPFNLKKIKSRDRQEINKYAFSQSKKSLSYDLKNSVVHSNGLDAWNVVKGGIQVLSSKSDDPYIVFKSISQNAINEPILHINLESNRRLFLSLYYQTTHMPKFDESQSISYTVKKGSNSIYIKIPEKDFMGPFRIDAGSGNATEVIIQDIELQY